MLLEISQNSQENTQLQARNFIKKETLHTFFTEHLCTRFLQHLWTAAFEIGKKSCLLHK